MTDLSRELVVLADGIPLTGFVRARLTGQDALGLYPMPFTLRVWNLAEEDDPALAAARFCPSGTGIPSSRPAGFRTPADGPFRRGR